MIKPLVSIIILSALRKACTQRCLKSIDKFTMVSHEIIIVDMGGDKNIKKWLIGEEKKRNNLKVIFNAGNVGTSRGRNQGIKIAQGKYIVFLDNDIVVSKYWLFALIETFRRWPKIASAGSKIICPNNYVYIGDKYIYDTNDKGIRKIGLKVIKPYLSSDSKINIEKEVPWYSTGCLMVYSSILKNIGAFDENLFSIEEDKDLCLKIKKIGKKIIYCPKSYVIHDRIRDSFYENHIRYKDIGRLKKDISYFEAKWDRKVELIYSKKALKDIGYSEILIKQMTIGRLKDFFSVA
ncbi:MAG: glycosyltransferase [Candidatus Omnitrophica bacterium]|jgi:GT2 family glycosyltransferase|nr:glycosyltransferase [Candidatus Omnitrophota bacterium]